ncbi:hypothetical protein [Streptomyces ramulosus]|uniref:hypothetical protein n=1 Tax=Streptomyces TaxID=1883 RepID=UPI0031E5AD98
MKTTPDDEDVRQKRRDQAWAQLSGTAHGASWLPVREQGESPRLQEIAHRYDTICRHAEGHLQDDVTVSDALAALLVTRMLREKLDADEALLTDLARDETATWERIAEWTEVRHRQTAERRHLRLLKNLDRALEAAAQTQDDYVDALREARRRQAERLWALENAVRIRRIAAQLADLDDLQHRVDHSSEAQLVHVLRRHHKEEEPPRGPLTWPAALRDCVAAAQQHAARADASSVQHQEVTADLAYRLLGLTRPAADRRSIDLTDHPTLADAIIDLHIDARERAHRHR